MDLKITFTCLHIYIFDDCLFHLFRLSAVSCIQGLQLLWTSPNLHVCTSALSLSPVFLFVCLLCGPLRVAIS